MSQVIDTDQHMFELPDMWREYSDASRRDLVVRIEPDDLAAGSHDEHVGRTP